MDGHNLYKRYSMAKMNWQNWRSLYDEAYSFAIPDRDPWPEEIAQGTRKNIQVYDITAVNSTERLVSKLHASLMPSGEQWFALEAGDAITDPNEKKVLNAYLQKFTDIIFQALNDSNFDLVINEMLQDLVIGTGALLILESSGKCPIKCKSVSVNLFYPEANSYDEIESVWRDFNDVLGRDVERMWPKGKLTPTMASKIENDGLCKFCLIEGVIYYPKEDRYRVIVMENETKEYIMDVWSKSTPWIIARWSKNSNEIGGRGPVIKVLPTVRSLNALTEEIMRNVALSTSPPWMAASDGVFNPYLFQIAPNKIIPISRQSMGEVPLQRLDVSGDVNMGNLEVNDLRMQIKEGLYDNPVRPVTAPEQTATEVMIRQQQFMEEIGPAFGRLSVELQPKIIERVIYILQRKGYLPDSLTIDNKHISIRYQSPLVKSAELQKVQNLQNYIAVIQPIMGQELALGTLELDQLPQWLADKFGVDESLVKSPAAVHQLIEQIKQAANPPAPGEEEPNPNTQLANQNLPQRAGMTPNG